MLSGYDLMKPVRATAVRLAALILLTLALFGCDYATKSAAKATLEGTGGILVAPDVLHGAVELRYVENDDIAFSALQRLGIPKSPELLIGLSAVALVVIVGAIFVARRRAARADAPDRRAATEATPAEPGKGGLFGLSGVDFAVRAGVALVVSGALGNIVDRVVYGYVVDFIHVKGWPVFNVADIAVVLGALVIAFAEAYRRGSEAVVEPST